MSIWLVNFPLPPSVNEYLMPVAGPTARNKKGKLYTTGRWVKTEPHKAYMRRCHEWRALHNAHWWKIQDELQGMVRAARAAKVRLAFQVDTYFAFEESRLWTVNGLPQRLDADNRLKPCRDALAELLGIDDKYFFSGFFEKVSTTSKDHECTFLRISQTQPRTLQDLRLTINAERASSSSVSGPARPSGQGT